MGVDMLDVLCCQITIGYADPANPMVIKDAITLTEVQEIEINESYKTLIGTAKIVFPKGTVYQSTIIGNATIEGQDASRITTEIMQDGVIIEKRTSQQAMTETSFKIGQRINIKLGYNGVLKICLTAIFRVITRIRSLKFNVRIWRINSNSSRLRSLRLNHLLV